MQLNNTKLFLLDLEYFIYEYETGEIINEFLKKIVKIFLTIAFNVILVECRTIDVYTETGLNEFVFIDFKEVKILSGTSIIPVSTEEIRKKPSVFLIIPSKDNKVKYNDYNFQYEISKTLMWSRKFKQITLTTSELNEINNDNLKIYLSIQTERKKYVDRYRPIDFKHQSYFYEDANMKITIEKNKTKTNLDQNRKIIFFCMIECEEQEKEELRKVYQEIGIIFFLNSEYFKNEDNLFEVKKSNPL